ncbi:DNA topology modulation protein [uncultured Vagococcus sp.]|jgi:adenylate kinase family enzyme|uniref:DNA topology modulation protein n=1 Tax=uncultured Vagococcus sp. TaxID=189676 RepID=UPI00258E40E6|nr:DNA topology modulation protein [uncultured Vagococcus sp.]
MIAIKKIIIIGSAGAGKSTFSRKLSEKLNIEVFHLDTLMWKPNWEMTDKKFQIRKQQEIIQQTTWIIDGNYNGTLDLRIEASDTIIFFDINRWVCLYQAVKRYFQYRGKSRPDMQKDCPEKLDIHFLKFIWHYPNKQKIQVEEKLFQVRETKEVIILKNRKQVEIFLESIFSI